MDFPTTCATNMPRRSLCLESIATQSSSLSSMNWGSPKPPAAAFKGTSGTQVTWRLPAGVTSLGGPAMEAEGWAWLQEGDGAR